MNLDEVMGEEVAGDRVVAVLLLSALGNRQPSEPLAVGLGRQIHRLDVAGGYLVHVRATDQPSLFDPYADRR